jgi:hypothetical protein
MPYCLFSLFGEVINCGLIKSENVVQNSPQSKQLYSGAYQWGEGVSGAAAVGGKMDVVNEEIWFSARNEFLISEPNTRKFNK